MSTYLDTGGSLAYLGGNGFYLMTALDPGDPTIMEMRRSEILLRTISDSRGPWQRELGHAFATKRSIRQWRFSLVASTGGVGLLPLYVRNMLPPTLISRSLDGAPPMIDLVLGYSRANTSPL